MKFSTAILHQSKKMNNQFTDKDDFFMECLNTHFKDECNELTRLHNVSSIHDRAKVGCDCSGDTQKDIHIRGHEDALKKSAINQIDDSEEISEDSLITNQNYVVEYEKLYSCDTVYMSDEDFENSSIYLNRIFLNHEKFDIDGFYRSDDESNNNYMDIYEKYDDAVGIQNDKCKMKSDMAKRLNLCSKFGQIMTNTTGFCVCSYLEKLYTNLIGLPRTYRQIFANWFDNNVKREYYKMEIENTRHTENFRILELYKINLDYLLESMTYNKFSFEFIEKSSTPSHSIVTNATKSSIEYGSCFNDFEEGKDIAGNMESNIFSYYSQESVHEADICHEFSTSAEENKNFIDEKFPFLHLCEDCCSKYMVIYETNPERSQKCHKEVKNYSKLISNLEQQNKEIFQKKNRTETSDNLFQNHSDFSLKFICSNCDCTIKTNSITLQNVNSPCYIDDLVNLLQSEIIDDDFTVVILETENSPKFDCDTCSSEDAFSTSYNIKFYACSESVTSLSTLARLRGENVIFCSNCSLGQIENIYKNSESKGMEDETSKMSGIHKKCSGEISTKSSRSHRNDSFLSKASNISQQEKSETESSKRSHQHSVVITESSRSVNENENDLLSNKTKSSRSHTKSTANNPSEQTSQVQSKKSLSEETSLKKSFSNLASQKSSLVEKASEHASLPDDESEQHILRQNMSECKSFLGANFNKGSLSKMSSHSVKSRPDEVSQNSSLSKVASHKSSISGDILEKRTLSEESSQKGSPEDGSHHEDISHKGSFQKASTLQAQSKISEPEEISHEGSHSEVGSEKSSPEQASFQNEESKEEQEEVSPKGSLLKVLKSRLQSKLLKSKESPHELSGSNLALRKSSLSEKVSEDASLQKRFIVDEDGDMIEYVHHGRNCFICRSEFAPHIVHLCEPCLNKIKEDYDIVSIEEVEDEPEKISEHSPSTESSNISPPKSEQEIVDKSESVSIQSIPPKSESDMGPFCPCNESGPIIVLECEESGSIEKCICLEPDENEPSSEKIKTPSEISEKTSQAGSEHPSKESQETPEKSLSKVTSQVSSDIVEEDIPEDLPEESQKSSEKSISKVSSKISSEIAEEELTEDLPEESHKSSEKSISKVSSKVSSEIVQEEIPESSPEESHKSSEKSISKVSSKISSEIPEEEVPEDSPEESHKSSEKSISKVSSKVSSEVVQEEIPESSPEESHKSSEKSISKISTKVSSEVFEEEIQETAPASHCDADIGANNCNTCDKCLQSNTISEDLEVSKTPLRTVSTTSSRSRCMHTCITIDIININQAPCSKKQRSVKIHKHGQHSEHINHCDRDRDPCESESAVSTASTKSPNQFGKTESCRSRKSCDSCGKFQSSHCFVLEKRNNEIRIKIPTLRCAECITAKSRPGPADRSVGFEDPSEKLRQTFAIQLCASCENTFVLKRDNKSNPNCELLSESADDVKEIFEKIDKIVPDCGCAPGCHHDNRDLSLTPSHCHDDQLESHDNASLSSKCDGKTQGLLIAQYITDTSIIFKWDVPEIEGISGYELNINGILMHTIKCPSRSCVILQDMPPISNVIHIKCILESEENSEG